MRLIGFGRFAAKNRKQRGAGKPETFDFLGLRVRFQVFSELRPIESSGLSERLVGSNPIGSPILNSHLHFHKELTMARSYCHFFAQGHYRAQHQLAYARIAGDG